MNQKNNGPESAGEMNDYLKELEDDPPEKYEYPSPASEETSGSQRGSAAAYWITVLHFLVLVGSFCAVAPLYKSLYLFVSEQKAVHIPAITRILVTVSSFLWDNYLWLVVAAVALALVAMSYRYRKILALKDYIFIAAFMWLIFAALICIILLPLQFSIGL